MLPIKRVRAMPDGSYKLMADNPQVREETAVDGEMFVIGRVVGVIRRT
jgi:phage repressor protein C with HTH and peptisase S24 domain